MNFNDPTKRARSIAVFILFTLLAVCGFNRSVQAVNYSGRITDGGAGVGGVGVTWSYTGPFGATGSGTAPGSAANGNWSSTGWGVGTAIRFRPTQAGYTFSPAFYDVNTGVFGTGGRSDLNFTRTSYSIAGTITRGGVALSGVTVTITGPMGVSGTNGANGSFSFSRLRTGTYTITPSQPGTEFFPANRTVVLSPSQSGQNFAATVATLPAANVNEGRATLRGEILGERTLATSAWFEYGTVGAFNLSTAPQIFPPGAAATSVEAQLSNLAPGVIYNFRLAAANTNGTNVAQPLLFTVAYPAATSAVTLDGIDDFLQVGTGGALKMTNTMTLEAWINPTRPLSAADTRDVILGREGEYLLARGGNGQVFYAKSTAGTFGWRTTGLILPNQRWTHLALTYNGTNVTIYTNGASAFTEIFGGPIGDANTGQNDFRIGGRQAAVQYFQGQIDEVRVWNVARSAAQVQANYRLRLNGSEPGLVAYFPFDELEGTMTTDRGPFSWSGTLTGGSVAPSPFFTPSGAILPAPVIETLPASPMLATRATLQSRVNAAGSTTTVRFEYGETLAYGELTGPAPAGSGLGTIPVSVALTNLQPGTTYHFRARAENSFGVVYGENQTFTTLVLGVGWPTSTKVTGGFSTSPRHVMDVQGNAYVAGIFSGSATFQTTMDSLNGTPDVFVGKLARGADWTWNNRVTTGTGSVVTVTSIALDEARNVYIAGQFTGTASFGTHQLTGVGGDAFVAKLNAAGNTWLWARSAGAASSDSANGLAVTPSGSVFIAGHFSGTVNFGGEALASAAGQDVFVAKLDTAGNWLWARNAAGSGATDTALAIALNGAEEAYVTGRFQGDLNVGATLLSSGGPTNTDLFVARISTGGIWMLATRAGGAGNDAGTGLALDGAGQVYLLGQFGGTADYNNITANLNQGASTNLFVAKLSANANLLWYAQAGEGYADSIVVDSANRVYITGEYNISTRFGNPSTITLNSEGNSDVFLARLNPTSGAWLWAESIGSSGSEMRGTIGVDGQGGVVVTGTFQNSVEVGYVLLTTSNERDIFIARFDAEAVAEHNNYVIGQPVPVPADAQNADTNGGAIGQPSITILERDRPDSDAFNSFAWDSAERKLYPVRPVTAILKWPLTTDASNLFSVATAVGRSVWPDNPQIHVAQTPVDLEPNVEGFSYRFLNLAYSTINGAEVESSSKQFSATQPGFSVLQFLDTGGELPNPTIHPSRFEVVRTVLWNDGAFLQKDVPATIGAPLSRTDHSDPTGKNGYVFFERAFYDGAGNERAHDRAARRGPIIPVNKDSTAPNDDLVVVWYRTNSVIGIAWPSRPVHYNAQWPSVADSIVLASGTGSGILDPATYPNKRLYNQPDATMPGYNPNEEHATLLGDTLYALRNDLNSIVGVSEPYALLKYQDPTSAEWRMKVFRVMSTSPDSAFTYDGFAGQLLELPAPLSLLSTCASSNTWISGPGYKDYLGRIYALAAGPNDTGASIVARFWYPLQSDFFYDLDLNGQPDAPVGRCLPWLDRRPGGTVGVPINVTYNITWPTDAPILRIGENLLNAKDPLPGVSQFARAKVIYDDGDPTGTNMTAGLTRLFDPMATRTVQLRGEGDTEFVSGPGYSVFRVEDPDSLFLGIATANKMGLLEFSDLPYFLRARLRYDPLQKNLAFSGLLDESDLGASQDPLLLLNVLSPRERDRIKALNSIASNSGFNDLVDALYALTRNPNHLDTGEGAEDQFLAGLTMGADGRVVPETFGEGIKVLTAGTAHRDGYVTIVQNDDAALGGAPVKLHVIRIENGPFRGEVKIIESDNAFDEKLTLRHSADFGGEPQNFDFEWYYKPVGTNVDASVFPLVATNGAIADLRGWVRFTATPPGTNGVNDVTLGDGGASSLLVLSDNFFICRYRGYVIDGATNWSDWIGDSAGTSAQLAEGWVNRVRKGLNPFETRSEAFHENETVTFASMLQQAGPRYRGDIVVDSQGDLNDVGLIEAYQTVLNRAKRLSIEGNPSVHYQPANDALLKAAGYVGDLYMLLGNEAFADAADPTIGFRTDSAGYGTLAPSIFTFQNQVDSLLEEELTLLRGRDTRSAGVRSAPVYNRLFWNFTQEDGEVAYAQAYNITDQNSSGVIDAADARIMYPQGHGDAWGHYLTTTTIYYSLLRNSNFVWIPRIEPILLAAKIVNLDYQDERKFARAAAAKAKTGAQIVDLTYRLNYVDDPAGQYQGYKDTDSTRAWGVSEWAHRTGSGAFFDWVTANAILHATDPITNHVGIEKIDRTTVAELDEIVAGYEAVQAQIDKADAGLNPLGLAKNSVPFDIDPNQVSGGKTHFEQIYDRALAAMNNTVTLFNHANQLSQGLRALQDSVNTFSRNADDEERDYKNRLIELFGYPYEGDVGFGRTYPAGYDGPDLYHYMYVNTLELNGETAPPSESFTAFFQPKLGLDVSRPHGLIPDVVEDFQIIKNLFGRPDFYFPDDAPGDPGDRLSTSALEIEFPVSPSDYGFTAPPSWGQRRAPGEIQQALSDLVQNQARFKQAQINYDNLIQSIEDQTTLLQVRYDVEADRVELRDREILETFKLSVKIEAAKKVKEGLKFVAKKISQTTEVATEAMPKTVGTSTDVTSVARSILKGLKFVATTALNIGAAAAKDAAEKFIKAKEESRSDLEINLDMAEFPYEIQQQFNVLEDLLRQEAVLRVEAFTQQEILNQSLGRYQATLAKGLRLIDERIAFRKNTAADTQVSRYQDMTFRIFRNDAIQKYRAQFDLAAQYVFLAAVAYDYETELLGSQNGSGRAFMTDIIRQRSLGEMNNGLPIAGRHGLADPLARLNQNFGVLKGQLGFNNPQTETGRFSLRGELFRHRDTSHEQWRATLKSSIVSDLWQIPEFRRYCRPFAPEAAGPQPGLIIRFPTTVTFGRNFFGWPLGGRDNAYDPTVFATKVRSAGVWFEDYLGSGLSLTPRVYLIPVGADVMRSPSGNNLETREWRVVDQKIPVPFPIGFSSLNSPTWIPMNDSLSDTFADIRRFSSFRAYHDSGAFDPSETITDSRLIGRSVWNTDWMLIIPGGTFLADPGNGLETFINSVGDIKIFFQTYSYSGN